MKQTALEFYINGSSFLQHEFDMKRIKYDQYQSGLNELQEKAKEMEKEQKEDAWWNGMANWDSELTFKEYYNETYGKDERD